MLLSIASSCAQHGPFVWPRSVPFRIALNDLCSVLQAGDKVKALKCLIRSGDTDKVIFFAGVSRHAEIYTLAANYLQTLDWHARPDLAQSIVTFYSKVSFCTLHAVKHAAATRAIVQG